MRARLVELQYRPFAEQAVFHEARYAKTFRGAYAGTGSGKTLAGAFEALSWMLENPGSVGVCSEPSYPMLRRTMIPAWERILDRPAAAWEAHPLVARWRQTEHLLELVNGSRCWMMGVEHAGQTEGPNLDFWWADEVRLHRDWPEVFRAIRRRLRGSRAGHRIGCWLTTHSPTKEQADFFEGPERNEESALFRWSTRDAVRAGVIPEAYLRDMLAAHTGPNRLAVLEGRYARPEGVVYTEFDPTRHVQAPGAANVYQRFSYGVDWGFTVPAAIVAIGWRGEVAHVVEEVYGAGFSMGDFAAAALELQARWKPGVFYCDASRPEHVKHFIAAGLDAKSYTGRVADGVNLVQSRFAADELLVAPGCVNLLRELDLYSWRPGVSREEPEKGNNHALDGLRYSVLGEAGTPVAAVFKESWRR